MELLDISNLSCAEEVGDIEFTFGMIILSKGFYLRCCFVYEWFETQRSAPCKLDLFIFLKT